MAYNAGVSSHTMSSRGPSRQDTYLNNKAFDYAVHNLGTIENITLLAFISSDVLRGPFHDEAFNVCLGVTKVFPLVQIW